MALHRRWFVGIIVGAVVGVGLLVGGPIGASLGVLAAVLVSASLTQGVAGRGPVPRPRQRLGPAPAPCRHGLWARLCRAGPAHLVPRRRGVPRAGRRGHDVGDPRCRPVPLMGTAIITALFLVGPVALVPAGLWLAPQPSAGAGRRLLRAAVDRQRAGRRRAVDGIRVADGVPSLRCSRSHGWSSPPSQHPRPSSTRPPRRHGTGAWSGPACSTRCGLHSRSCPSRRGARWPIGWASSRSASPP